MRANLIVLELAGRHGKVGFFTFPPNVGMSAGVTYIINAKSPHADCAAFFLNWAWTNEKAREIDVKVGGGNPGGPPDGSIPQVAADSVIAETLNARSSERQGRLIDSDVPGSMEKKKQEGYF